MRCIFCKNPADTSRSEEHIVPESLGGWEHVLPRGWVCDSCNNYFSREVEAPFLSSRYGLRVRFDMQLPSKRGRVPPGVGLHVPSLSTVYLGEESIWAAEGDSARFIRSLRDRNRGTILIPCAGDPPADYVTSRFVAKVALEVFAYGVREVPGSNDELVDNSALDPLRVYVRRGTPQSVWPLHIRRIYQPDRVFTEGSETFQLLNEWTVLVIPDKSGQAAAEYYVVLGMLGIEYVINLGGPEIEGYAKWLRDNGNASPLYPDVGE